MKKTHSSGFTLVELMLAMAFFSFIILFMTTGFILVNRAYNKGLTVKLVQDEGRRLVENLTREMRATSDVETSGSCLRINGYRYYWTVSTNPSGTDNADSKYPYKLYKIKGGGSCSEVSNISTDNPGELVLDERVGVQYLNVEKMSTSSNVYKITMILSTAEGDLLTKEEDENLCTTDVGGEYCGVAKYTTIVSTR